MLEVMGGHAALLVVPPINADFQAATCRNSVNPTNNNTNKGAIAFTSLLRLYYFGPWMNKYTPEGLTPPRLPYKNPLLVAVKGVLIYLKTKVT